MKTQRTTAPPMSQQKPNSNSADSVLRLRRLIHQLINEVESLDERSLSLTFTSPLEKRDNICFYEEVERFESALIRSALRRTGGHQLSAARLLNLNPSTLGAKIKQYRILPQLLSDDIEDGVRDRKVTGNFVKIKRTSARVLGRKQA